MTSIRPRFARRRRQLQEVDRYALARYAEFAREMLDAYDAYDYPTIFQRVNQLPTVDSQRVLRRRVEGSAVYLCARARTNAARRRRPCCHGEWLVAVAGANPASDLRRAVATSAGHAGSIRSPGRISVPGSLDAFADPSLVADWQRLIAIRDEVNRALESARQAKTIGTSLGAQVTLRARGESLTLLDNVPRRAADAVHRIAGDGHRGAGPGGCRRVDRVAGGRRQVRSLLAHRAGSFVRIGKRRTLQPLRRGDRGQTVGIAA